MLLVPRRDKGLGSASCRDNRPGEWIPSLFAPQAWLFPRLEVPADGEGHSQQACTQPTVSKHVSFPPGISYHPINLGFEMR